MMKRRTKGKRENQYECLQNLLGPKKRVFFAGGMEGKGDFPERKGGNNA